jgi:hypothetical protein
MDNWLPSFTGQGVKSVNAYVASVTRTVMFVTYAVV